MALHICGMILLVLWDGHLVRPLYFEALMMPTLQESSLDSVTHDNVALWDVEDVFLLSDVLLICPIVEVGERSRTVTYSKDAGIISGTLIKPFRNSLATRRKLSLPLHKSASSST
jgi:hypothetical protein